MKLISFFTALTFMSSIALAQGGNLEAQSKSVNELGWSVAAELLKDGENLVYSPLSTSAAMQMAVLGATGTNKTEMMNVMGLSDETLTFGYQSFVQALKSNIPQVTKHTYDEATDRYVSSVEDAYEITLSNSVWLNKDKVTLNPNYQSDLVTFYQAPATAIPFSDQGVDTVNNWVDVNTNGKIKKLIQKLDPSTGRLVLTNALRIKASWSQPFSFTAKKEFVLSDNSSIDVDTMMTDAEGIYVAMFDNSDVLALSLNTEGLNSQNQFRIKMHVIMPKTQSANSLVAESKKIETILNALRTETVDATKVQMPEFKIETEQPMSLVAPFKALGMNEAFVQKMGNFDGMLNGESEPLNITSILQKAIIEVDKNGFEAAAATAVGIGLESAVMDARRSAVIDQPFIYIISDEELGANLFVGVVNNPSK